jgi:hypothetical protein
MPQNVVADALKRPFNLVDDNYQICYNSGIVSKKEFKMQYTLITKNGRVMTFFLQAVAQQFQQAYGGVVLTQQVLVDEKSTVQA